jgi:hypothetical protein
VYLRTISSRGAARWAWTPEPARRRRPTQVRRSSSSRSASGSRCRRTARRGAGRSRTRPPATAATGPRHPHPLLGRCSSAAITRGEGRGGRTYQLRRRGAAICPALKSEAMRVVEMWGRKNSLQTPPSPSSCVKLNAKLLCCPYPLTRR